MYQKYANAMPLYRQEEMWRQLGVTFSRTCMAKWVIRCAEDWLEPLWDAMHAELLKRQVLHADETVVQVLREKDKAPQSKSYMWVYRTGRDGKPPIILYEYQPGRSGEYPKKFLKGFHGYLHTDGYAGYNQLEGITRCGCWAHLRRKFVEALPPVTSNPLGMPTPAQIGRNYCDQLFAVEKKLADLSAKERQKQRLAVEKPMLRAFWCWLDELAQQPLAGGLKKAVQYAQKQRPYMENYLLDGRCELSNNLAENAIRPFTVGRKNWLFCDTVRGAKASAVIYSLIETAQANDLSPKAYLHICRNFPEYTDQMKVFIQRDTGDASLCRTALSVLESFVTLLQQLVDGKTDLHQLIEATLVDEDGRPRTEHGQRPSELLVELAENTDSTYQKYHKLEDDIHIQTRYKRPADSKKGGISAATFYASDTLPALLFLEFVQMCAQDLPVALCESCHRLFVPFSSRAKYCERVLDPETGATCKDIAAKLAYAEELKANKAKELYNKMRNRYQMRCSRAPGNQKMRDDYNAWRKQAQMALSKYQLGEISWEEFERVMQGER